MPVAAAQAGPLFTAVAHSSSPTKLNGGDPTAAPGSRRRQGTIVLPTVVSTEHVPKSLALPQNFPTSARNYFYITHWSSFTLVWDLQLYLACAVFMEATFEGIAVVSSERAEIILSKSFLTQSCLVEQQSAFTSGALLTEDWEGWKSQHLPLPTQFIPAVRWFSASFAYGARRWMLSLWSSPVAALLTQTPNGAAKRLVRLLLFIMIMTLFSWVASVFSKSFFHYHGLYHLLIAH